MAAFNVGAIVQKKTGGIHGVVDSLQDPDGDHPQFWGGGTTEIIQCIRKTNYARPRQTVRSFIKRCHRRGDG
ncbi:hypothetical protein [Enterobacter kobei]|uniref:hypothetical protein n=1 Tax=Enterobacter kobei TaxID=208224 RepID=UPI000AF881E6|nr:hypothetical protein [Enterobacter kobei]